MAYSKHQEYWTQNSNLKIVKKYQVVLNLLLLFIYFSDKSSYKFWDQCPVSNYNHYYCCLQVSEKVSWHRFRYCYSSNMLQDWAWRIICAKWTIRRFPEFMSDIVDRFLGQGSSEFFSIDFCDNFPHIILYQLTRFITRPSLYLKILNNLCF